VKPWTWAAIGLAVFGMYLMVREGLAIGALAGNIAALLSATGFGAFSVCLRWGKVNDMLPVSMLGGVFAMAVAAIVLTLQGETVTVSTWDMGMALLIGAVILALGMVMYTLGSRVIPAAELGLPAAGRDRQHRHFHRRRGAAGRGLPERDNGCTRTICGRGCEIPLTCE